MLPNRTFPQAICAWTVDTQSQAQPAMAGGRGLVPGLTAKAPWHSVGRAVCADTARMLLWNGAGVRRMAIFR